MNWQPIENAPKDGEYYLVIDNAGGWFKAMLRCDGWFTPGGARIVPTHFCIVTPPGEQPESVNQRLLQAAEFALRYVEEDEETHGRQFATGNVLRAAIEAAKQATKGTNENH